MTDEELVARFPRTLRIDDVLGLVKRCSACDEWWSATRQFFGHQPGKVPLELHSHCHACTAERNRRRYRPRRTVLT